MAGKHHANRMSEASKLMQLRAVRLVVPLIVGSFMLAGCPSSSNSHPSNPLTGATDPVHHSTIMMSTNVDPPASVPEPPELPLFAAGFGLLYFARRRHAACGKRSDRHDS